MNHSHESFYDRCTRTVGWLLVPGALAAGVGLVGAMTGGNVPEVRYGATSMQAGFIAAAPRRPPPLEHAVIAPEAVAPPDGPPRSAVVPASPIELPGSSPARTASRATTRPAPSTERTVPRDPLRDPEATCETRALDEGTAGATVRFCHF